MSGREFEHYLALLGRLLRLSSAQREVIASELRDHMEQRLEQLRARGVGREDAITIALEEFGDAASLAGEFRQIAKQRKKRWMMRVTVGSMAASVAVILTTMALWPDPQGAPAPAVAQEEATPAGEAEKAEADKGKQQNRLENLFADGKRVKPALSSEAGLNSRIEARLAERTTIEFVETPLSDALDYLSENHIFQYYLDPKALEYENIEPDEPVNIRLSGVPLKTVIDLILKELDLGYTIRSGVLVITTLEEAGVIHVYNVRDLLGYDSEEASVLEEIKHLRSLLESAEEGGRGGGFSSGARKELRELQLASKIFDRVRARSHTVDCLIDLLTTAVDPNSWDSVGGVGTISAYRGTLVISQMPVNHQRVEQLLDELRNVLPTGADLGGMLKDPTSGGFGGGSPVPKKQ